MRSDRAMFKAGDIALAVLILLCAAAVFVSYLLGGTENDTVTVKSETGISTYSLREDRSFSLNSNGHTLSVVISDGKARVESADCPDKVCVNTKPVDKKGGVIVCVPAKVEIKVGKEASGDDKVDWVAP